MENLETLEGKVEREIFSSADRDYTVFSLVLEDESGGLTEVVCTANAPVAVGEEVKLHGSFVIHPSYGQQFKAAVAEKMLPKTTEGMAKYLAENISGIGIKRAAEIIEKFGFDTFSLFEDNPQKLSEIKGITLNKAMQMSAEFMEKSGERNTMMYLQSLGLTANQCDKVYKRYGPETTSRIKDNPYILIRDIFGIGFKIADGIAFRGGIAFDSAHRIFAGIGHVLSEALMGEGHVYLPKEKLLVRASSLLGLARDDIENQLLQMQMDGSIKQDKVGDDVLIYLAAYYHAEVYSARKLLELASVFGPENISLPVLDVDEEIITIEKETGITLANMQKEAVKEALKRGVVVITGGPGTGKTTTIKTIIHILEKMGQDIVLCAPTGRAAKRMSEATGMPAATIHRLLGIFQAEASQDTQNLSGEVDEDMKIDADCIIVDEASMVDIMLLFRLLRCIKRGARLILVGDVNQLPSVGAGNVLKDIIKSSKIKPVYLDEIFRQGRESAIVMNAHRINRGGYPVLNDKDSDFFFIKEPNMSRVAEIVAELASVRLPKFLGSNPVRDIQILCPQRKTLCGVENLNKVLQEVLNPPCENKEERNMGFFTFRQGDKVMHVKNNYIIKWKIFDKSGVTAEEGEGIFNGDEGIIDFIDNKNRIMRVVFYDDKVVDYDFSQLEELTPAYAITIHKSQGSEYDVVILPIHSGTPLLFNRNLLYTAITRAKKMVVIVGIEGTLRRMVDNIRENVRYSNLDYRLVKFYESVFAE